MKTFPIITNPTPAQKAEAVARLSFKDGLSQRARGGVYRIRFDRAWCHAKPFAAYINGSAGPLFASLEAAYQYLNRHAGAKLRWTDWT